MKYTPIFLAKIVEGKIVVYKKKEWQAWLKSLIGKKIEIRARVYKSKRSDEANALYWAWLTLLQEETGQNKDDFHDFFKKRLLTRIVNVSGTEEKVVGSSANLNTLEFYDYLNNVQQISMEFFNIILPNPYEDDWKAFRIRKERKSVLL